MKLFMVAALAIVLIFGCAEKPSDEFFYVRETTTNHCFKAKKTEGGIKSEWIGCNEIPSGAFVQYMEEWQPEEYE